MLLKKITTILLLIIFCNSIFYYSYFYFSLIKAKIEAACAIANSGSETAFIKIPTDKLQKDESDEAWYKNKLYDVAKRESVNDTEYVYLMRDEEEQDVLNSNNDYFKNDSGIFFGNCYKTNIQKKSPGITDNNYMLATAKKLFFYNSLYGTPTVKNKRCFTSICADVPTPPPKVA